MKLHKREVSSDGGGSKNYLKVKPGENVVGVFRGEVFEYKVKWVGQKSTITDMNDPEGKTRFKVNFVVYENGKFVAKVWEFGIMVYNQMAEINELYDITTTKVRISRQGAGTDTSYTLLPVLKEPIGENTLKAIANVELQILNRAPQKQEEPDFGPPPPDYDEPLPF